jgi:hypothetical protein
MTASSESSCLLKSTTLPKQNNCVKNQNEDEFEFEFEFEFELCHSSYSEYYGYSGC